MVTAAEIFAAAGWTPHPTLGYQSGTLVHAFRPRGGGMCVKDWGKIVTGHPQYGADTPDSAEEAARWLVRNYGAGFGVPVGSEIQVQRGSSDETNRVFGAEESAAPPTEKQDRVAPDLAGGDYQVPARAPAVWPVEPAPVDAVFADIDTSQLALVALDDSPIGGGYRDGAPRLTEDIKDFAPDPIREGDVSQFIFGDNLALDRLVRQGQVADRATVLIHEARSRSRFDANEFNALQNYVVSNLDAAGSFTGDATRYARFVELSDAQTSIRKVESLRDAKIDFIRIADREAVACFDPQADWPEF